MQTIVKNPQKPRREKNSDGHNSKRRNSLISPRVVDKSESRSISELPSVPGSTIDKKMARRSNSFPDLNIAALAEAAIVEKKKSPKAETPKLDRYGFILKDPSTTGRNESVDELELALKWAKTLRKYSKKSLSKHARSKLKKRCYAGIPDRVRGEVWKLLLDIRELKENGKSENVYQNLLERPVDHSSEAIAIIERDLNRTFPEHILFREKGGIGQKRLYNVLKSFSMYRSDIGYCQGMGFIVALFLMYMEEEDAFWGLVRITTYQPYDTGDLYKDKLPGLQKVYYILEKLLINVLPRITSHLNSTGIDIGMYSPQWFITLFIYNLPFPVAVRVWDVFLIKGYEFIYYVALAVFKILENKIMQLSEMEDLLHLLKLDDMNLVGSQITTDLLIETALHYQKKVKKKFHKLEKDFMESKQKRKQP